LEITGEKEQKPPAPPAQKQGADQPKDSSGHKPESNGHNNR